MTSNQRGFFLPALAAVPLSWWIYGAVAIAFIATTGTLYARFKIAEHQRDSARAEVVTLTAERDAARKRATDLALLASQRLADTDKAVRANQEKNDGTIATLESRARALQGRLVRLSADAARVLNDASTAANSAPAAVDQGTAPPVPEPTQAGSLVVFDEGELAAWGVKAAAAYMSCKIKHAACVTAYEGVRSTYTEKP